MGLFDKKNCDICGEKIGLLGNRKLDDGNLCKNCASKLSPWFEERRHSTVEDIKRQLEYREKNKNCLTDGVTYRFHHMMKECAERAFMAMDKEKQTIYLDRYGKWYEEHKQYLHALDSYRKSGNFDAALRVIRKDAGILLASLKADDVLNFLSKCPKEGLKKDATAP